MGGPSCIVAVTNLGGDNRVGETLWYAKLWYMNQQEYLKTFEELTTKMLEITKNKNSDYCGDVEHPFKNFVMSEQIGFASAEQGFLTRMVDKVMRVSSFVQHGILKVADEKVEDTLLDLATYSLLFICYLRSKK